MLNDRVKPDLWTNVNRIWEPDFSRYSHLPLAWCHSGELCEVLRSQKWRSFSKDWTWWSTLEQKGRDGGLNLRENWWFPFIFHHFLRVFLLNWKTTCGYQIGLWTLKDKQGMSVGDAAWENWKPSAMEHYPPKMSDVISWTPLKQFGPGQEKRGLNFWPNQNSIILCTHLEGSKMWPRSSGAGAKPPCWPSSWRN